MKRPLITSTCLALALAATSCGKAEEQGAAAAAAVVRRRPASPRTRSRWGP
ncbi:hypothetical protein [Blastococcus brunescens]|uniref:Uncharacterized protein n=1 Tax=Blastococcus brunescens TaxID=1564165 RepID=A0ABZ1BBN7_9ACTN|nr:hypothetical protein [Blastococcus sp. BMG 8361]WRL67381.1 hypothetical protein U6N30_14750 [Blastococcus sp. BMG 8361]